MDTLFGEGPLKIVLFVVVVLGLLALAFWLVRRFGGGRLGSGAARGRQPRLAVIDQANVDGRRRLVLIRRDNIEHLLIIGGPSDVVVEQNIVRAATAAREGVAVRPPAADTLPRAVPLGEESVWPPQPEPGQKAEATPRVEPPPLRAEPRRPPMASEEPMSWPGDESSEPQAPAAPPQAAPLPAAPPPALPFARERKPRGADPLADLAEELSRVPAASESAEQRRMPRLQPAPPPEPAPKSPADQNLSEMAQRLEAALRRPAKGDDARTAAGAPKSEPASEPLTAAPSSRSDAMLRRPFKGDDLRAPLSPPKPVTEPTTPAADEASADSATGGRGRGSDAKGAGGKSFYDSLEEEMASLLNRPSSKP
jgi:flagellar protein FliO/FliZ